MTARTVTRAGATLEGATWGGDTSAPPGNTVTIAAAGRRPRASRPHVLGSTAVARSVDREDALRRSRPRGRARSAILTWRCATCRGEWTLEGSAAKGACTRCGTPAPRGRPRT